MLEVAKTLLQGGSPAKVVAVQITSTSPLRVELGGQEVKSRRMMGATLTLGPALALSADPLPFIVFQVEES